MNGSTEDEKIIIIGHRSSRTLHSTMFKAYGFALVSGQIIIIIKPKETTYLLWHCTE